MGGRLTIGSKIPLCLISSALGLREVHGPSRSECHRQLLKTCFCENGQGLAPRGVWPARGFFFLQTCSSVTIWKLKGKWAWIVEADFGEGHGVMRSSPAPWLWEELIIISPLVLCKRSKALSPVGIVCSAPSSFCRAKTCDISCCRG